MPCQALSYLSSACVLMKEPLLEEARQILTIQNLQNLRASILVLLMVLHYCCLPFGYGKHLGVNTMYNWALIPAGDYLCKAAPRAMLGCSVDIKSCMSMTLASDSKLFDPFVKQSCVMVAMSSPSFAIGQILIGWSAPNRLSDEAAQNADADY